MFFYITNLSEHSLFLKNQLLTSDQEPSEYSLPPKSTLSVNLPYSSLEDLLKNVPGFNTLVEKKILEITGELLSPERVRELFAICRERVSRMYFDPNVEDPSITEWVEKETQSIKQWLDDAIIKSTETVTAGKHLSEYSASKPSPYAVGLTIREMIQDSYYNKKDIYNIYDKNSIHAILNYINNTILSTRTDIELLPKCYILAQELLKLHFFVIGDQLVPPTHPKPESSGGP